VGGFLFSPTVDGFDDQENDESDNDEVDDVVKERAIGNNRNTFGLGVCE